MSNIFISLHSIARYFVLLTTLIVAIQSVIGMTGKKAFGAGNRKSALFMMISCDVQLLLGLAVFFLGGHLQTLMQGFDMKDKYSRFYLLEHPVSMLIGIVLVHVGYAIAKKNADSAQKFKRLFWCSTIALLLFVAQTPWPGKGNGIGRPLLPGMAAAK